MEHEKVSKNYVMGLWGFVVATMLVFGLVVSRAEAADVAFIAGDSDVQTATMVKELTPSTASPGWGLIFCVKHPAATITHLKLYRGGYPSGDQENITSDYLIETTGGGNGGTARLWVVDDLLPNEEVDFEFTASSNAVYCSWARYSNVLQVSSYSSDTEDETTQHGLTFDIEDAGSMPVLFSFYDFDTFFCTADSGTTKRSYYVSGQCTHAHYDSGTAPAVGQDTLSATNVSEGDAINMGVVLSPASPPLGPVPFLSVSATNTPLISQGISWSGYGSLPWQLETNETTTNFFTRIFSVALGVDTSFSINSTSSTAPGFYQTPAAAQGIVWAPGTYTVVTTQMTNYRNSSATTTVFVADRGLSGTGGGGSGGGGGGSWGVDGVPPIPPAEGFEGDSEFAACEIDLMPTGFFDFITSPGDDIAEYVKASGACFIATVMNIVKGVAPFKWVYQFNSAWNTATSSATATPDVALSVPSAQAGGTARTITLISSSSTTAGISGAMSSHAGSVKTFIGYGLYLLFGFYLLDRALNTKIV